MGPRSVSPSALIWRLTQNMMKQQASHSWEKVCVCVAGKPRYIHHRSDCVLAFFGYGAESHLKEIQPSGSREEVTVWGKDGLNPTNFHEAGIGITTSPGGSTRAHMLNLLVKATVLFKNKISQISIMSFPNPCEMKMRCFTQSSSSADILKYQLPASFHSFGKETVQRSTKNPFEFQKTGFSGLLSLPARLWASHLTSQDLIYTRDVEVLQDLRSLLTLEFSGSFLAGDSGFFCLMATICLLGFCCCCWMTVYEQLREEEGKTKTKIKTNDRAICQVPRGGRWRRGLRLLK